MISKFCIGLGTIVGGYVAGWAVSSFGIMTSLVVSGAGSMVGCYLGWKLARKIEYWSEP